ncbi:putative hemolysin [Anaerobacterium chartisolvens]|uniref:Putative hemolysin n=1 Tax=Anaerobacterium chartisolvens TaxID=1297424 RepID=A0A369B5D0_9FIRM|nr:hemolysin family protein [Anaerobacterium chartisolvens]RCX16641.1 putative hemolysin [Anaerobacterium chartisolvens]
MFTEVLVLIILIIINAFFAASEIALISLNDNKIKMMAEEGNKKAVLLKKLLSEPSRFLATIQIGITLAGFLASAFAADSFADPIVRLILMTGISVPEAWLKTASVFIVTVILSYFTLVLGELVPKRVAMKKAESISMFVAGPLSMLLKVSSPFVKLLTLSTNFFVRLFGVDPNADEQEVTEEEIRMMVDVGEERGAIDESEKEMINNVFEFDNKIVSDIMTHRTHIAAVDVEATLNDVVSLVKNEKYTRIPVYEGNIDNIIGTMHVKDLIQLLENQERDFVIRDIIRKPYFIPASKRIDDLFQDLQRTKTHMAIAIDEYGGTAGIVTIDDLIEEIVGNIFDEYDEEEKDIEKLDENTFMINGSASLDTVRDFLKVDLPVDDYDTLSGFVIGQLGRIPQKGESPDIEFNGLVFRVDEIEEKKIARVKVCRAV